MTTDELTRLAVGHKITVYTSDGKGHTGHVAATVPAGLVLRVVFSTHESALFAIPPAQILYWCGYFDASGDPIMEQP